MDSDRNIYGYQDLNKCKVTLHNKELWTKFHNSETEMIITKSGRRMFPAIRVQVENLDPRAHYCVFLEMNLASKCRYKYSSSLGWAPAGSEEAQSPHRLYVHPESPATGEHWMSQPISFGRLKLTNTLNPQNGQVVLSSMHKYQPRIVIMKSVDPQAYSWAPSTSVIFPETQFIAVTAYQNDKITKLKIDHNPFAKGFRENGQAKCKRKRNAELKEEEEENEEIDVISSSTDMDNDHDSIKIPSPPVSNHHNNVINSKDNNQPSNFPYSHFIKPSSSCCNRNCLPLNNYYENYMSSFYPTYYNSYYSIYNNTAAVCNNGFNYSRIFHQSGNHMTKPVEYRPIEKKARLTDFSIRAITGIS